MAAGRRRLPQAPWHRFRSAPATLMPPWAATRTARLALSAIVPTTRFQVPSSAMMVTAIRASEAAREDERGVDRTALFEICHLQSGPDVLISWDFKSLECLPKQLIYRA